MSLVPIRTYGKFADAAYSAIRTGIRMGHIPPGTRLQEAELALQLGTSKTPVREALGRLVSDGLATTSGRTGIYVTRLSHEEIVDLYEAREIIEPQQARLAAERATESDILALQESLSSFEVALAAHDIDSLMELDSQFHEMIASIAGNRVLAQTRDRLDNWIAVARVASIRKAHHKTSALALKEHKQIYSAIAKHDSKLAEQRMAEHIRRRRDGLLGRPTDAVVEGNQKGTPQHHDTPAPSGASPSDDAEPDPVLNPTNASPPGARTAPAEPARSDTSSHPHATLSQGSPLTPEDHAHHPEQAYTKEGGSSTWQIR